jgi:hypothetical protein
VESTDPHRFGCIAYQFLDPPSHLSRRLVRKGDRQDPRAGHPQLHQSGDSVSDHPRFPRSSAGKDEEWPAWMLHSFALFGIQGVEIKRGRHWMIV